MDAATWRRIYFRFQCLPLGSLGAYRSNMQAWTARKRYRLITKYNRGVREWAQAVGQVNDQADAPQSQYLELLGLVDDARATT
jgi:hypothetical protein